MTSRDDLLERVRAKQRAARASEAAAAKPLRIIMEFEGRPDPEMIAAVIRAVGLRSKRRSTGSRTRMD